MSNKTGVFCVGIGVAVFAVIFIAGVSVVHQKPVMAAGDEHPSGMGEEYVGSASCKECHDHFHELWATSHHGRAMQPFTSEYAEKYLCAQKEDVVIEEYRYRYENRNGTGFVLEDGPDGHKEYRIEQVMGGKNVYYFLTMLERGRLQVLPVAFDVNLQQWYDMAGSGVRHFVDREDQAVSWRHPVYTFNTSCFSCHVSQLARNYDLETDTYKTIWKEPGINCETCHGASTEHVKVYQEAAKTGIEPKDPKIIQISKFTHVQNNETCAPCHAKMSQITNTFQPGDRYFDHYNLVTLEHVDFYPDGRDLGENYTYTTWMMSPCGKSGTLDCTYCHTSSGRYRFADSASANKACLPCHAQRVKNVRKHSHHSKASGVNHCISCHMPMTRFANMDRSDHSMRPPTPMLTIKYQSPNACNICHTDKSAEWANKYVTKWHGKEYQKPVLYRAGLVDEARKGQWQRLDEMVTYMTGKNREEVTANSLVRLLMGCPKAEKWPVMRKVVVEDASALIRSSAAMVLTGNLQETASVEALLKACSDDYRLVRIQAAASMAGYPVQRIESKYRAAFEKATQEYTKSLQVRQDDAISHYNLGNFHYSNQDIKKAMAEYELAMKLRPNFLPPFVNMSMLQARLGDLDKAEQYLLKGHKIEPENPEVCFNLGLLMAEKGDMDGGRKYLQLAIKHNPDFPEAAYNLAVLVASSDLEMALTYSRKAYDLRSDNPKYAYSFAYYLNQAGQTAQAVHVLEKMVNAGQTGLQVYVMLGDIYQKQSHTDKAEQLYHKALKDSQITPYERQILQMRLAELKRE